MAEQLNAANRAALADAGRRVRQRWPGTRDAIAAALKARGGAARAQAAPGDDAAARARRGNASTPAIDAVLALLGRERTRERLRGGSAT